MSGNNLSGAAVSVILLVILIVVIFSPLIFIWALNTLFALNIAYGFYEWLAAIFLLSFLQARNVNGMTESFKNKN